MANINLSIHDSYKTIADNVGDFVCIKSYIKQVAQTESDIKQKPGLLGRVSNVANNVKQDLAPKKNLLDFLQNFFPGLLLGYIINLTKASGNALIAIQLTLEDNAKGVVYPPADFKTMHSNVVNAISLAVPYLAVEDVGLVGDAKKIDVLLEDYIELISRRDLDINTFEKMAHSIALRAQKAQKFIAYLQSKADQISKNVAHKTEKQVIENAKNESGAPTGFWGRIVNWVKNKIGRGKSLGITAIRPGELNLFITNLGLAYHLAATSTTLIEKIIKTSIMDRNSKEPRTLSLDVFNKFIDEIQDTFEFLAPENVPTLDYISIKTKIDTLFNYAKLYLNTLNDNTIESTFKVIQLRSVCLLIVNNLRDLTSICLKMDPLIAVTDI